MRQDAIEELYKLYYNDALLYSLSIAGDKQTAEDVVHSAFYKALLTADGVIDNFKAWLIRVCRNELYTKLKKGKRQQSLDTEQTAQSAALTDEAESAIESIIRREEYRALHRAMSLMKTEEREYLTLFYFEELTIAEIADVMQKSTTATKVALYRARENLKKIFSAIYNK